MRKIIVKHNKYFNNGAEHQLKIIFYILNHFPQQEMELYLMPFHIRPRYPQNLRPYLFHVIRILAIPSLTHLVVVVPQELRPYFVTSLLIT